MKAALVGRCKHPQMHTCAKATTGERIQRERSVEVEKKRRKRSERTCHNYHVIHPPDAIRYSVQVIPMLPLAVHQKLVLVRAGG
jgi:hypothetical protein